MESHRLYGYMRRCPDLHWDADLGRYLCGLMAHQDMGKAARKALHEGLGCCAPLNDWRNKVRNRDDDP